MTEVERLVATEPKPMLQYLTGKASDRKLRLFSVACCYRMIEEMRVNRACQKLIEVVERFADGGATVKDIEDAFNDLAQCGDGSWISACYWLGGSETFAGASWVSEAFDVHRAQQVAGFATHGLAELLLRNASEIERSHAIKRIRAAESRDQTDLISDIFPFRPITLSPSWLTSTVLALANGIYSEKAFDRMPILADALQDAGCDNAEILDHCRGTGEHVRGCWLVDLLLGRQ
jgi:hypothetical protein